MIQHETSILNAFASELRDEATLRGMPFEQFPTDGQDRKLLADTIFTNYEYFLIVEGKDSEKVLASEGLKTDRVVRLCAGLEKNKEMQKLHDRCHFIGWREYNTGALKIDVYRNQICNEEVLGTQCGLKAKVPKNSQNQWINSFSEKFLGKPPPPEIAVGRKEFEKYIRWLVNTVTAGETREIELLGRKKDDKGNPITVRLKSMQEVFELLDARKLSAKNSRQF